MFLKVDSLTKRFGGLVAVNNISFEVQQGEIVSLIGPNGAGKSTLFKLIASFLAPNSGKVMFRNEVISGLKPHLAARKGVLRTFQETTVFKDMTALENVLVAHHLTYKSSLLGAYFRSPLSRKESEEVRASALAILEHLRLGHIRDELAKNLPHGYLRGLGIAIAMAARPRLLLLDEPFAGMNPEETDRAVQMVDDIRKGGVTVLLVEHDMRAVMRISDRIVVVNFGTKIAEGTPQQIRNDPQVVAAYLGQDDDQI